MGPPEYKAFTLIIRPPRAVRQVPPFPPSLLQILSADLHKYYDTQTVGQVGEE
jgi:hypothetical protein